MTQLKRISAYICLLAMFQNIAFQTVYAMRPGGSSSINVGSEEAVELEDHSQPLKSAFPILTTSGAAEDYHPLGDGSDDEELANSSNTYPKSATKYRWAEIDAGPTSAVIYSNLCRLVNGHGVPLIKGFHRSLASEGFLQGLQFMITRMLNLGILTLTAFQYSKAGNIIDVFDIFNGGDKYAITALAYNVNQNDEIRTAVSWVATLPLWWGAGKAALITYLISRQPEKEIDKTITKLSGNNYHGLWQEYGRWVLPLHPVARELSDYPERFGGTAG